MDYQALVDRLLDRVETEEVVGAAGTTNQVEVNGTWDAGRPPDQLVIVGVDDGTFRGSFRPVARSFIVAHDGSIVSE